MATFQRNVRILVAVPLLLPHQFGDQRWEMVCIYARVAGSYDWCLLELLVGLVTSSWTASFLWSYREMQNG